MGGQVLEYEAKDILNKGRREGHIEGKIEGKIEGRLQTLKDLVCDGLIKIEDAADRAGLSVDEFENYLRTI